MRRLKIGLIGCGQIARSLHLSTLAGLKEEFELVAVCDSNESAAGEAGARFKVRQYTRVDEMLEKEKQMEVVDICTYAFNHHEVGAVVARAGRHMIVEKPIAITLPCADALISACGKTGALLEVAENYPWMPMDRIINAAVRGGLIGEVKGAWIQDAINGFSLDIGVHRAAQLREAVGAKAKKIWGFSHLPPGAPGADDSLRGFGDPMGTYWGHAIVEFENKARGICECFPLGRNMPKWGSEYRRIVGTKGTLSDDLWPNVWPLHSEGKMALHVDRDGKWVEIPIKRKMSGGKGRKALERVVVGSNPEIAWDNPYKGRDFIDSSQALGVSRESFGDWQIAMAEIYMSMWNAVVHNREPSYGSARAREDLELCMALYESSRRGGTPVDLPLRHATAHELSIHRAFKERFGREPLQ